MVTNEKQYPTADKFLVCEDIRHELFRKLTFVGAYTGDTILTASLPIRLAKLSFYQRLRGGKGKFKFEVKVSDPSGKVLGAAEGDAEMGSSEETLDLAISFGNIKLEVEGTYSVETYLDRDHKIASFHFRVSTGKVEP